MIKNFKLSFVLFVIMINSACSQQSFHQPIQRTEDFF